MVMLSVGAQVFIEPLEGGLPILLPGVCIVSRLGFAEQFFVLRGNDIVGGTDGGRSSDHVIEPYGDPDRAGDGAGKVDGVEIEALF